jgi:hypothetical protein
MCATLVKSEARRRTAWKSYQILRLTVRRFGGVVEVPTPRTFVGESQAVVNRLLASLERSERRVRQLQEAIAGVRPFLANTNSSPEYPHAMLRLNQAMDSAPLSEDAILAIRREVRRALAGL